MHKMNIIQNKRRFKLIGLLISFLMIISLMYAFYLAPSSAGSVVYGVDVSHWQGTINWNSVYSAGYRFAFVKASEGVSYQDPNFVTNMANAKAAGLYVGAYHFARPDNNAPETEADHFVDVAGSYIKNGYLRPVLDLETGTSLGWSALSDWANRWLQRVQALTGVEPIIYVNSYYANHLASYLASYDLWIAHYTTASQPNTGIWSTWAFWQYTDSGSVPGISGNVDLNKFNGDLTTLATNFVIGGSGNGSSTYTHYLVFEVTASTLNVRTGPGTSYSKVGTVSSGQRYVAVETASSGSLTWYKFWYDGQLRWVAATGYTKVVPWSNVIKVTASTLNVRSGPSTGYSIIGQVHKDEMYVKHGSYGNWFKIYFKGRSYAWVYSSYTQSQSQPGNNYFVFEVTATNLNVRTGPSTSYSKVGQIHNGQKYVVIDVVSSGSLTWYKFWYDGQARWCAATGYTKVVTWSNVFEVTATNLNVRSGPSTAYSIIGTIHNGEMYVKYGTSGSWYHFWYAGRTDAWSHSGYVRDV